MNKIAGENSISIDGLEHLTGDEKKAVAEIRERVNGFVGRRLRGLYVFGSKARGDYDSESDVDLAILIDGLDRETKRKIIDLVADVEIKYFVVISSLVLSWKDFTDLKKRERRIAFDIEREGISL
jgi:predicted nucleotidyltransferase